MSFRLFRSREATSEPDGKVCDSRRSNSAPAIDWLLWSALIQDDELQKHTRPTVAPVNLTRKKALVPEASSFGLSVLVKTWYGA